MIEAWTGEPELNLKFTGLEIANLHDLLMEIRRRDDIDNYAIVDRIWEAMP